MGNINIELSDELHRKAKIYCAENSVTIKSLIIELLEREAKAFEKKGKAG